MKQIIPTDETDYKDYKKLFKTSFVFLLLIGFSEVRSAIKPDI